MKNNFDVALSFAMEDSDLVETVYYYLKAEELSVFYAPVPECQSILSGKNQREVFYRIFGKEAGYVVLFVSKDYVVKPVPMEEARIAFSKHAGNGTVIPVYIDGTALPKELLDPRKMNYFSSNDAAAIASHVAAKIEDEKRDAKKKSAKKNLADGANVMNVGGNTGGTQFFIQNYNGEQG